MNHTNTVCLVHFSTYPGGTEVLLPEIINGLHDIEFISFVIRPETFHAISIYNGLKNKTIHGSTSNIIAGYKLFRFAKQKRQAIFHVFNIGPLFLLVLRLAGVKKLIYSIHGTNYWNNGKQKFLRKIIWWLAINRNKYRFTSNSEYSKKVFLNKINNKITIETLYNPINLNKFNSINKVISEPDIIKKIIYVGRLTQGKGLENWLKYAIDIHEDNPWIKFEIYGDGPLRTLLQRTILENEAYDYITLKGHISDIGDVYRDADLLLFLSEYESFGNVVVESILCGTPVITGSIPSMMEIFSDFPEFLVEMDENLKTSVLQKIRNPQPLNNLVTVARKNFMDRFNAETHYKKLKKLYGSFEK